MHSLPVYVAVQRPGPRFWVGVALIVGNSPVGWGLMFLFTALAAATAVNALYVVGAAAYGVSWVMLGLGVLLAGPEGFRYARAYLRRLRTRLYSGRRSKT